MAETSGRAGMALNDDDHHPGQARYSQVARTPPAPRRGGPLRPWESGRPRRGAVGQEGQLGAHHRNQQAAHGKPGQAEAPRRPTTAVSNSR